MLKEVLYCLQLHRSSPPDVPGNCHHTFCHQETMDVAAKVLCEASVRSLGRFMPGHYTGSADSGVGCTVDGRNCTCARLSTLQNPVWTVPGSRHTWVCDSPVWRCNPTCPCSPPTSRVITNTCMALYSAPVPGPSVMRKGTRPVTSCALRRTRSISGDTSC